MVEQGYKAYNMRKQCSLNINEFEIYYEIQDNAQGCAKSLARG